MSFNLPATVTISRPQNLLILVIAVVTGAFAAGSMQPYDKLVLACFSALFIMAGGNAVNDYFDVEIDRVNKPFRPLPAGRLTLNFVRNFFIISFVLGIFLSIFI
jgi:geranylgeranylglycerol-phosphate geranylgeranyltransferase